MKVNLPVYNNNPYVVNNQKQNSKVNFTSGASPIGEAVSNPVLKLVKEIMCSSYMKEQMEILEKTAKNADEFTKNNMRDTQEILKIIKGMVGQYLEKLQIENTNPKNDIKLNFDAKQDIYDEIHKLINEGKPYRKSPIAIATSNYSTNQPVNKNAASVLWYIVAESDSAIKQTTPKVYLPYLMRIIDNIKELQVILTKGVN